MEFIVSVSSSKNTFIMQTRNAFSFTNRFTLITALFFLFGFTQLGAQDNVPDDLYFEVACFKSKKAGSLEYFKTYGKKIHEEMIRQGIINEWKVFTVDFPNGADCDCSMRAVRIFNGIESLDKLKNREVREQIIKNVWPNMTLDDIRAKFSEVILFKNAQVYKLIDAVIPGPTDSDLSVVNFMDVSGPNSAEYERMELEVFKSLHVTGTKNGNMVDWFLAEKVYPYGADAEYDYITVDKFDSYAQMNSMKYADVFTSVHPTMNLAETMTKMNKLRKLRKSEIWRYVPMGK